MKSASHMILAFLFLGLVFVQGICGQVVVIGPKDPNYCDHVEHVEANLKLTRLTHVFGIVLDQSGAPFKNSVIELRKFYSTKDATVLKAVTTDGKGHFDLGSIGPGNYRLLPSSTRAFQEPEQIDCGNQVNCRLLIELRASPTGQLASNCPIK